MFYDRVHSQTQLSLDDSQLWVTLVDSFYRVKLTKALIMMNDFS